MTIWQRVLFGIVIVSLAITVVGVVFASNNVPWPGSEASGFISAVAQLLSSVQWLVVVMAVALLFRAEIRKLIPRISTTEFFGNKVTIAEEVSESSTASALIERLAAFEQRFERIEGRVTVIDERLASAPGVPASPSDSEAEPNFPRTETDADWFDSNPIRIREAIRLLRAGHSFARSIDDQNDPVTVTQGHVLDAAASSPVDALYMLTDAIRDELYGIARPLGLGTSRRPAQVAKALAAEGIIDQLTADALKKYWAARSAAYHAAPLNEDLVLDTIDSGLVLLRVLGERGRELASRR